MVLNIYIRRVLKLSVFWVNVVDFVSFLDFVASAILIVLHYMFLFTFGGGGTGLLISTYTFVLIL
jgi:hypothetical protein